MKLRISGNSLRIRVTRSELDRLVENGRIEDTIQFAPEKNASFTYALECSPDQKELTVVYRPEQFAIAIPLKDAQRWASSELIGMSADLKAGDWALSVLVEKDFACLDGSDAENVDSFPHPNQGANC